MFAGETPAWLLEVAEANLSYAVSPTPENIPKPPKIPLYPRPVELLSDGVRRGEIGLFMYTDAQSRVFAIPATQVDAILARAGLLGEPTRETIVFRFVDMYPARILADFYLSQLHDVQFEKFALCLRERALDDWLANIAHRESWPLDLARRRGRGRPDRVSVVKPLLKAFIDGGWWRQGMPLKELCHLINSKLKAEEVDRETVKKGLAQLYAETGQLAYRYVPRKRRASKKPRPK